MKNFLFSLLLIFSLASFIFCGDPVCDPNHRNDCGYVGINQQECEAKGCCWQPFEHLACNSFIHLKFFIFFFFCKLLKTINLKRVFL